MVSLSVTHTGPWGIQGTCLLTAQKTVVANPAALELDGPNWCVMWARDLTVLSDGNV